MKIIVEKDDGTTADITEEVQVAYDTVYGSMDWGSGFLSTEEVDAIIRLGEACGFPGIEDVIRGVWADRRAQELNSARTSAYEPRISAWKLRETATAEDLAEFKKRIGTK